MSEPSPPPSGIRVPLWVLGFLIPILTVIGGLARMEYRQSQDEGWQRRIEMRFEAHLEAHRLDEAENERRHSATERTQDWLCAQRARDDSESGRGGAGVCP